MTAVITVPSSLDDLTFEPVIDQLAWLAPDEPIIVDARQCAFSTPFGLAVLLTLAQARAERPIFLPPEDADMAAYWARNGFFRHAELLYDIRGHVPRPRVPGGESDVMIELTPLVRGGDTQDLVQRLQTRVATILVNKLHLESRATMGFTAALSEWCQTVVERSTRGGWVMAQLFRYKKRLDGRLVAVITVCDAGVGVRQWLEDTNERPLTGVWDDAAALEAAVVDGTSKLGDAGRGLGIKGIRGYVHRWDGKLSVRSGTARIALIPQWDDDVPLRANLAPFAGTQVLITIPEKRES